MYAFTCCNLRVGKFDVSASNMIIFFASIFHQAHDLWTVEMNKAFATCASQYSWNTVIENHLNAKEKWSRHGIQA